MKFLLLILLSISIVLGQSINGNSIVLSSSNLPKVNTASVSVQGSFGSSTYYYWIVANYPAGQAPVGGPFVVSNANSILSASNFNRVNWNGVSGASSYDLLRVSIPGVPGSGSNIAVATGIAATTFNDNVPTASLSTYNFNTIDNAQANISINNLDYLPARTIHDRTWMIPTLCFYDGTCQTTAGGGALPDQTGNAGKVLGTDGVTASWVSSGGGGTIDTVTSSDNSLVPAIVGTNLDLTAGINMVTQDGNNNLTGNNHVGAGAEGFDISVSNASVTGTVNLRIAKYDSNGDAIVTSLSDTEKPIGVLLSGGGTTGLARIIIKGNATCEADNTVAILDWIVVGTSTAGRCRSVGASLPTSGYVLGRATTAAAGAGNTFIIEIDVFPVSAGSGIPLVNPTFSFTEDWGWFNVGSGTQSSPWLTGTCGGGRSQPTAVANHPGIMRLTTGGALFDTCVTYYGQNNFVSLNNSIFDYVWRVRTDATITTYAFYIGWLAGTGVSLVNALWFEFDTSGPTALRGKSCSASVCSNTASLGTVTANTWLTLRMRSITAGTVLFSACVGDGCTLGVEQSISSNIPSIAMNPALVVQTLAASARYIDIDYTALNMNLTR